MKTKILMGAVAALLYGGVALADDKDCPPGTNVNESQSMAPGAAGDESLTVIETEPLDQGIGGSGQVGVDESLPADQQSSMDQGIGGSSTAGAPVGNEMLLRCQPVKGSTTGTGGSGVIEQVPSSEMGGSDLGQSDLGEGGSGYTEPLREPQIEPQVVPPAAPVTSEPSSAFTPIEPVSEPAKSKSNMRGLTIMVGGGLEGYSGALAPNIDVGPSYGVMADIRPSRVLGIELAYSGAVNNLDPGVLGSNADGPDLVRNGGQAAVTLGLTATPVQPYVLGGVGLSDYNFRGTFAEFRDDTVGNVPVGAGLRTHIGSFTADLRADYNFLFDQDFAPGIDDFNENGRYSGTLNIGGTF